MHQRLCDDAADSRSPRSFPRTAEKQASADHLECSVAAADIADKCRHSRSIAVDVPWSQPDFAAKNGVCAGCDVKMGLVRRKSVDAAGIYFLLQKVMAGKIEAHDLVSYRLGSSRRTRHASDTDSQDCPSEDLTTPHGQYGLDCCFAAGHWRSMRAKSKGDSRSHERPTLCYVPGGVGGGN